MGADSQGNGAPQAPQGTGAPEAPNQGTEQQQPPQGITLEDVNRAITARNKDFEKKLEAKLGELTGGITKGLEAKLQELLTPKGEGGEGEPPKPKGEGDPEKQKSPPKDPEVIALKSEVTKLKNAQAENERRVQAAEAKRRDVEMRQLVTERLAAHGIDGVRAKHAIGYLVDASRSIVLDESGGVSFRGPDGEPVDLESGIKSWVSTDEAKIYLPPRGTAGSGDRLINGGNGPGNTPKDPRGELTELVGKAFSIGG
jgi:hypothetical protein